MGWTFIDAATLLQMYEAHLRKVNNLVSRYGTTLREITTKEEFSDLIQEEVQKWVDHRARERLRDYIDGRSGMSRSI